MGTVTADTNAARTDQDDLDAQAKRQVVVLRIQRHARRYADHVEAAQRERDQLRRDFIEGAGLRLSDQYMANVMGEQVADGLTKVELGVSNMAVRRMRDAAPPR